VHTDKGVGQKKLKQGVFLFGDITRPSSEGTCSSGLGGNRNEILYVSFEEWKMRTT